MSTTITILPGDGIGPEVTAATRRVLETTAEQLGKPLNFQEALIGGCAIDATGSALPDESLERCRQSDAVLLGAVGGPKWDDPTAAVRPEQGLLKIRKALGLFANLRPVQVHPQLAHSGPLKTERVSGLDLLVIRELTGGIYFGEKVRRGHESGEEAWDAMHYTTGEIERIIRRAAAAARMRRGKLTSVDKANVLEVSRLWRSTTERVMREEFPDVELEHILVDAASMYLIQNPKRFDVIVTGNMFGDILTDEASVLAGSMGMLPSASLGEGGIGLYEPIHGSAPDIAGKGLANPCGTILSAAMMCRYSLGWTAAADAIEHAVSAAIDSGARTADLAGEGEACLGTSEMTAAVLEHLSVPTAA
jgi:3-isopropylmalate dehydrogenase